MDRLNIKEKREGDELTHSEWNSNVSKINELVDTLNGSSSVQRKIFIQNNLDGKNLAGQKGEPCFIDFTFVSQERYSYSDPYENTGERGNCQVLIKNAENAEYTLVKQYYINSNVSIKLDVAEWLTSGANSIMIKAVGEITEETTPAYTYTIQLTTLSVAAPNFRWWQAFTGSINVPLLIGGNINKKLFISLTGVDTDYHVTYNIVLGNATYTETAYNYSIPHPGVEGVYRVKAYVTNADETLQTRAVEFEVMCSVALSQRKLVCINHKMDKATNWMENKLFEYAMCDGDATTTSATFNVLKEGAVVFQSVENAIATHTKQVFSLPMEIETDDDSDFQIQVTIADDHEKLTGDILFSVNNSYGYSAAAGAVFYMNPKTRSNSQANSRQIVNEADSSVINTTWTGMNWGNDGWQTDAEGNKVLRILAGSSATIDYKPFEDESARTGRTIEIDFRADNVVDGTEAIISMFTPSGDAYNGYRIAPEEITMFSQAKKDGTTQHLPIDTGVRIRATLTIMPDAYGNNGFNLCCMYINGKKNRVFNYESNDYFANSSPIRIGSNSADVDIYGLRIYNNALTSEGVQKNYINWLVRNEEKEAEIQKNEVLDSTASAIDFNNTKEKYNVFVFDQPFPKKSDPSTKTGTVWFYFADKPEMNCSVTNMAGAGQGTSSKLYYEWNIRWKMDKSNSLVTYADGTTGTKKVKLFNGIPAMASITAKKNWASSMQDHKIGSVNAYNDLFKQLGFTNPAIDADPEVRVAVYQEPFIGFSRQLNDEGEYVYTCMGEFTLGPDKGDKYCFGFDTDMYPNLIAVEGSDNAPLPTLFRVPWSERMVYNEDEEAFQYNGANSWDFNAGETENISLWKPAYNLVYQCSNRIKPFEGTLDELNARVLDFRTTGYEYWIAKADDPNRYNLYYYEAAEDRFIPSDIGNGTINLYSQLVNRGYGLADPDLSGKTPEEVNTLFILARTDKFRKEIPAFFDVEQSIFHSNFIEFVAGTDNRAKNTYAYHFGTHGSKWQWWQDDLDTVFPIDNQGQDKKPYYCEVHDQYANGAHIWNGETSVFWNLLELAFPEEMAAGMKKMLAAMEKLSGKSSGTSYDKLYGFYEKYYLSVKNYFPANLVNADARRYENAKLAYIAGSYSNDTDPITQSHGDFYSAETAWVKKRINYIMSKYSYGTFSADGTDTITVRAAGNQIRYDLVPAMTLYPAIANGTSIIRGERTMAGQTCPMTINLGGAGDQQNNIQGASYLMSIGDWHEKNVSGTMIIQGRRLQEIILGSKTDEVKIAISGLTISNCSSVRKIVLSNISTLSGVLDVSTCTHLKEIYADGTSLAQIKLPEGGGLEKVEFSEHNTYLLLRNFPMLKQENVGIDLCDDKITDFLVQDCGNLNPVDLLIRIMEAQDNQSEHALKRVRAVGFEATYSNIGSYILDRLAQLADGSYIGLSSEGLAGEDPYPVLDGIMNVYANVYEDSLEILRNRFSKLDLNVVGEYFVRFKDSIIGDHMINTFGNGKGLTKLDLSKITFGQLGRPFKDNNLITSFDEFKYFTGLTELTVQAFSGCSSLQNITLPDTITVISWGAFGGSNIKSITIPKSVKNIWQIVFENCKNLENVIFEEESQLKEVRWGIFSKSGLKEIDLPDSIEIKGDSLFYNCSSLKRCKYPNNPMITVIDNNEFYGCSSLETIPMTPYITKIGSNAFRGCSSIQELDLSNSNVQLLGIGCFFGCRSMRNLKLNNLIKELPYECFRNCGLIEVEIPEGVDITGTYCFCDNANLVKVILPASTTSIPENSFQACKQLESIIVLANTPPTLAATALNNTNSIFRIYVPDASVNVYKSATVWNTYANHIYPLSLYSK